MRLTGLNKFVKALVQSRYERGARISRASSSSFSSASSSSVRHSKVSHCSFCMMVVASPLTRGGRYLTAWWSIVASGVLAVRGVEADARAEECHDLWHVFRG